MSSIFLGVHGEVIALDRTTGQPASHAKPTGAPLVNLVLAHARIIATTKGKAFCLDAATGQLLWRNDLPGLGLGLVSIVTASGSTTLGALSQKRRQDQAAASTAVIASS